jgi:hypothetical protein
MYFSLMTVGFGVVGIGIAEYGQDTPTLDLELFIRMVMTAV